MLLKFSPIQYNRNLPLWIDLVRLTLDVTNPLLVKRIPLEYLLRVATNLNSFSYTRPSGL